MNVVADSSVLIALGSLDLLDLLRIKFGRVRIAPAVRREVVEEGGDRPAAQRVAACGWIEILEPRDHGFVKELEDHLDPGEAEALVLAREVGADRVLLDEKVARRKAATLGLVPLGTVGVLILAKRNGRIPGVREAIHRLAEAGFHLSREVIAAALREVGEA